MNTFLQQWMADFGQRFYQGRKNGHDLMASKPGEVQGFLKEFQTALLEEISLRLPTQKATCTDDNCNDPDCRNGYNQAIAEVRALLDNMKKCS